MAHTVFYANSPETVAEVCRLLEAHGFRVAHAHARTAAIEAMERGDARVVIVEADRHDDDGARLRSIMADHEAYERDFAELKEKYEGRYIAMYHGEVIGVADTAMDAARAGLQALGRPEALFVIKAGEPLPETERDTVVDDIKVYERRRDELAKEYGDQYIAMYDGEVIGVGDSKIEAARAGVEALGRPMALLVIKAGEPLPEPLRLGMRMDTPRRVVRFE